MHQEVNIGDSLMHRLVLKPGGVLAISEFLPDPDFPLKSTTMRMVEEGGFRVEAVEGSFWDYTARAVKP